MPAMTIANQISFAKRLARQKSNAVTISDTDDVVRQYLNMGVEEFVKTAGYVSTQNFVTITPAFWGRTDWYVQVTIAGGSNTLAATNVAITPTDYDGITGGSAAAYLSTQINAASGGGTMTVTWSDSSWVFSIAEQAASTVTSIDISEPSLDTLISAADLLLGKTGTDTGTSWTSNFPEDCTLESDLPSDFYQMEYVDYDGHELYEAPFDIFMSPETNSNYPEYYAIKNKKIYITPSVNDRRILKVRYRSLPASVDTAGTNDGTTCALPDENHMAPVYYAAGMLARENFEQDEADRLLGLFYDQARNYKVKEANQNTKMFPRNVDFYVPKVEPSG